MKYKTNFVTNSSSSSFIIAFSSNKYTEKDLEQFPELKLIDKLFEILFLKTGIGIGDGCEQTEEGYLFENELDVWKYIRQYEWGVKPDETGKQYYDRLDKDDYDKQKYNKILQKLTENKKVIQKTVSYHDESLNELIKELAKQKIIEIVDAEEE